MKHEQKIAAPFASLARFLMLAKGSRSEALELAKNGYALPVVTDILKSAIEVGSTSDSTWASALAPMRSVSDGFLQSLAPFSALDRIISDGAFKVVPLHSRIAVTTVGATGGTFAEREIKTPTKVQLENAELKLRKCAAFVAVTDELLRHGGAPALALLSGELRKAVAIESDRLFLAAIAEQTGAYSTASTGTSAAQITADIAEAMEHLTYGADARLYLIAPVMYCKAIAMARGAAGAAAFPDTTMLGGSISGMQIVPSDAADSVVILDASQMAVDGGIVVVDASENALLQLDTETTDAPATVYSLWQNNMKALKAERVFGAELLRASAATVISGVTA